jgi:hypothetical protein
MKIHIHSIIIKLQLKGKIQRMYHLKKLQF